jgi:hypothetical protein
MASCNPGGIPFINTEWLTIAIPPTSSIRRMAPTVHGPNFFRPPHVTLAGKFGVERTRVSEI